MTHSTDEEEIRALIADQFASLNWKPGDPVDWSRFYRCFLLDAQLYPSRRPARPQITADFIKRLRRSREAGMLRSFSERGVGCVVMVVGNVAVALAGCEMTENEERVTRDVSGFLLVKNPDGWKIAAQAWDTVEDIAEAFSQL